MKEYTIKKEYYNERIYIILENETDKNIVIKLMYHCKSKDFNQEVSLYH